MNITVNNITFDIASENNGVCVITGEKGVYRIKAWDCDPDDDQELAAMVMEALSTAYLYLSAPTFNMFRKLFSMGSYKEDRNDFERSKGAAILWKQASDIDPNEIIEYLETTYHL